MQIELGFDVSDADFVDLMLPWRHKAEAHEMKWPSLNELISEPEDYFEEGKVTGANVPTLWDYYLTGAENEGMLKLIMEHCFSDVLREATLLLRYPHH